MRNRFQISLAAILSSITVLCLLLAIWPRTMPELATNVPRQTRGIVAAAPLPFLIFGMVSIIFSPLLITVLSIVKPPPLSGVFFIGAIWGLAVLAVLGGHAQGPFDRYGSYCMLVMFASCIGATAELWQTKVASHGGWLICYVVIFVVDIMFVFTASVSP
jgi:hypothetical protein